MKPTDCWRQHPVFGPAGDDACAALAREHRLEHVGADIQLIRADRHPDSVIVLFSGTVATLQRLSDDRAVLTALMSAPGLLGDIEVLCGLRRLESAVAVQPVHIAEVAADRFRAIIATHPAAMAAHRDHLAAIAAFRARRVQQDFVSLERRLAHLLLAYAELFGQPHDSEGSIAIAIPLTQTGLADALGAARRGVAATIADWRQRGLLRYDHSHIVIEAPAQMHELVASMPSALHYRIGAPLRRLAARKRRTSGALTVSGGPRRCRGVEAPLDHELVIGRGAAAGLQLPDDTVCPTHCRVFRGRTGGRYWIEDLQSVNGTFVNGQQIRRAVLRAGDRIQIGTTELTFQLQAEPVGDPAPNPV